MTLPSGAPSSDSEHVDWLKILQNAYLNGTPPAQWPPDSPQNAAWRKMAEDLLAIRKFIDQITFGELAAELRVKGRLAGSLKSFQANLRHLAWQVQQVSEGDLTQRVDFMGDFSAAFNRMIENLSRARTELMSSEMRYRLLAENAADVIWTMDLDGRFTYISPSIQRLRGYTAEEALQQSIEESLSPTSARILREQLGHYDSTHAAGNGFQNEIMELEQTRKTGGCVWTEVTINALISPEGSLIGIQGASRDITERRRAQQAERDQRNLAEALRDTVAALNSANNLDAVLKSLLNNISRVVPHQTVDILLLDAAGKPHIKVSQGYDTVRPNPGNHILDLPVQEIPNLRQMVETGLPCLVHDLEQFPWVRTENTAWAKSHLGAPILVEGKIEGFFILLSAEKAFFTTEHAERLRGFADQAAIAIEKAHLFELLNELATTDALTEIANRRYFFNQAEVELARAQRYAHPLTAIMLDIDHFKRVNDTYGHGIGDEVLQGVARRCQQMMRKNDLLGRYGGEEFSILLPETKLPEGAIMAERLRQVISQQPFETQHGPLLITVSIGVAQFLPGIPSARALLDLADKALYQAKQTGRNRVVTLE